MLCPKCKKEMIVIERDEVELDYCMSCEGFWFDCGEWSILCKKLIAQGFFDKLSDIYNIPVVLTGEKPRRCPVCSQAMEKFAIYDVILDRCPNKHGIWFDKNEFSACVNASHVKTQSKQIEFLGEVFNR